MKKKRSTGPVAPAKTPKDAFLEALEAMADQRVVFSLAKQELERAADEMAQGYFWALHQRNEDKRIYRSQVLSKIRKIHEELTSDEFQGLLAEAYGGRRVVSINIELRKTLNTPWSQEIYPETEGNFIVSGRVLGLDSARPEFASVLTEKKQRLDIGVDLLYAYLLADNSLRVKSGKLLAPANQDQICTFLGYFLKSLHQSGIPAKWMSFKDQNNDFDSQSIRTKLRRYLRNPPAITFLRGLASSYLGLDEPLTRLLSLIPKH